MLKLILLLVLCLGTTTCFAKQYQTYTEAIAASTKEGTPSVVFVTANWCGPCQKLKNTTLRDKSVLDELDKVPWTILDDAKDGVTIRKYGVDSYPSIIYLDKNQKEIKSKRKSGYQTARQLINWLKK